MKHLFLNCNHVYSFGENSAGLSWDTIIALSGVIIAVFAIAISDRFQLISFVDTQLIEIAKTCNSYLQDDYQVHKDGVINRGRASGIVTALEDAEKIIKHYHTKRWLIFEKDVYYFKNVFYNHLHSSIKVILKDFLILKNPGFYYLGEDPYDIIRNDQLEKACKFFENEIMKNWDFEKRREKRLGIN